MTVYPVRPRRCAALIALLLLATPSVSLAQALPEKGAAERAKDGLDNAAAKIDDAAKRAADIFKLAMIHLDRALDDAGSEARMLLTVHDELVLEVPEPEREATEALVRQVMESVTELRVPLTVDTGFGPTWAEAK